MEVGSQTDPMDPTDILNLLRQREGERKGPVGVVGEDEIQTVEIIDGEVFFNSHNEPEFGKNGQSGGKSLYTKSKSHPAAEPSLTDKICEVVWSRKESIHGTAGSSGSSWKSKRLGRSHSFKGSSSSSANLSPTKLCSVDPYSRRASGSSSIIRTTLSGTSTSTSRSREFLPPPPPPTTGSPNFDPTKVRRSHGDVDLRRQISGVLSIPSRQDSCKSTSSSSEMERSNNIALLPRKSDMHLVGNNETRGSNPQVYRLDLARGPSSKSLVPGAGGSLSSARASRSNSVALSHISGTNHQYCDQLRSANPGDLKKHKTYIIAGFACLLFVAVACVIISLSIAPLIDSQVRQQNQELIRGIQIKTSTLNTTTGYNNTTNYSSSSTLSPLIAIDDQDETNNNQNSNNNNNPFSSGGQPMTRGVITIDPESEQPESPGKKLRPAILTDAGGGGKDVEKAKEKPLSSSLIGAVLTKRLLGFDTFDTTSSSNINNFFIKPGESRESVESSRGGSGGSLFVDENEPKNSPTEFKSENSNILLGQISDIDEVEERVRTSIVLR